MQSILVFCGSSKGFSPIYEAAARELGHLLAERDFKTVYGAGNVGLMGVLADAALEKGGHVIGVIPEFLKVREVCHHALSELHVVQTMDERKKKMAAISDAVIALAGGFGTLDELFEMATLVQLGQDVQPIGLLNTNGFFNPLIQQIDVMIKEGFVKEAQRDLILVDTDANRLLDRLVAHQVETMDKWVGR